MFFVANVRPKLAKQQVLRYAQDDNFMLRTFLGCGTFRRG
jgi:hypothetical protein